jgi:hypothetical protein
MLGFQGSKRFWVIPAVIQSALSALVAAVACAGSIENRALFSADSAFGTKPLGQPTNNCQPAVLTTIRPNGFDPREINSLPGRFLLAVDNENGLLEMTRAEWG